MESSEVQLGAGRCSGCNGVHWDTGGWRGALTSVRPCLLKVPPTPPSPAPPPVLPVGLHGNEGGDAYNRIPRGICVRWGAGKTLSCADTSLTSDLLHPPYPPRPAQPCGGVPGQGVRGGGYGAGSPPAPPPQCASLRPGTVPGSCARPSPYGTGGAGGGGRLEARGRAALRNPEPRSAVRSPLLHPFAGTQRPPPTPRRTQRPPSPFYPPCTCRSRRCPPAAFRRAPGMGGPARGGGGPARSRSSCSSAASILSPGRCGGPAPPPALPSPHPSPPEAPDPVSPPPPTPSGNYWGGNVSQPAPLRGPRRPQRPPPPVNPCAAGGWGKAPSASRPPPPPAVSERSRRCAKRGAPPGPPPRTRSLCAPPPFPNPLPPPRALLSPELRGDLGEKGRGGDSVGDIAMATPGTSR